MWIYNPDNFDVNILPKQITSKLTNKLHHLCQVFLHILLTTQFKNSFKDNNNFVPLKHRILQDQLDWTMVSKIRDILVARGIIECDYKCYQQEKCYWYRLTPQYESNPVIRIFIDDKKLERQNPPKPPEIKNEIHEKMWHWLNHVRIDYAKAKTKILQEQNIKNPSMKWISLEKMNCGDLFFNCDERGRVYHNIANMWSELRQFLTINEKPLVNIDIRNCQPLILAIKLKQDHLIHELNSILSYTLYSSRDQFSSIRVDNDVQLYTSLVEQGEIYDYLMSASNYKKASRRWFKKKFFAEVLYADCNKTTKLAEIFTELFPTVAAAICRYKENHYTDLPLLMQKMEADLMIDGVCGEIVNNYPNIPFITIHDSILTTPEHIDKIKEIIRNVFKKERLNLTFGN